MVQAWSELASQCIHREAPSIASTNVDLETATVALLARCRTDLEEERRAFINLAPGYRDYIAPRLRELDETRMNQARSEIAVLRTR